MTPDSWQDVSRRDLLKYGGVGALVTGGVVLVGNPGVRDDVVEESKAIAEILRAIPGLGYSGDTAVLSEVVGGQPVLTAESRGPGHWRGAPALAYDETTERLLTHVRYRHPERRGYRVSVGHLDRDAFGLEELVTVSKDDLNARSMEGGALAVSENAYRWLISYQHDADGDWRIHERTGTTVDELDRPGRDLDIDSSYHHLKDPAFIDGDLYVLSSSANWLRSQPERVTFDSERPSTVALDVGGVSNARITGGGVLEQELFADTWPNFLWTTDERSATGVVDDSAVEIDSERRFVSEAGASTTYVDAQRVGETVYMLWQESQEDGSKDLYGAEVSMATYRNLFSRVTP